MSERSETLDPRVGVGILLVLATAVISGVSTFVNLYAVAGTSSDVFVTVRNALVALMLLPVAVLFAGPSRPRLSVRDWARLGTIGVVGGAVPFLLFFHGLQLAAASGGGATASFFYRTLFLMATVLAVVVLRERFRARIAVAAGLLLAGNLLLLAIASPVWTDGTLFVVAATALWAVEYTISKRTLRDLPSSTVALGRMGIGAVVLFGYLAVSGQLGGVGTVSGPQWQWLGISSLLLAAFVATWYSGLRSVDLSVATAVLVLGFPITWLLTVLVRGSVVTPVAAVGAAAVVAGVVAVIGVRQLRATRAAASRALRRAVGASE